MFDSLRLFDLMSFQLIGSFGAPSELISVLCRVLCGLQSHFAPFRAFNNHPCISMD